METGSEVQAYLIFFVNTQAKFLLGICDGIMWIIH